MSDPTTRESCARCKHREKWKSSLLNKDGTYRQLAPDETMETRTPQECTGCIEIVHKNFEPAEDG